jgi:hypothetical protein
MAERTMTDPRASRDPMLHFRVETAGGGFDGHSLVTNHHCGRDRIIT